MEQLLINGKTITSLEDLRQNFNLSQVKEAFLNQTLEEWLSNCFYEREAEIIHNLKCEDTPAAERALCEALNIPYLDHARLTQDQRETLEHKRAVIAQHTSDQTVLSPILDTALNQVELGELLAEGRERIYLCDGTFSIPIRKSGIHYVGIDSPKINTLFTEEQYRRAGITLEGILLPENPNEQGLKDAELAAANNGYDNYDEKHNTLAVLFHKAMKAHEFSQYNRLNVNCGSVASEFYKSRFGAKNKAHAVINRAYDQASSYFSVTSDKSVALPAAEWYAERLRNDAPRLAAALAPCCVGRDDLEEKRKEILRLAEQSEDNLRTLFADELAESSDYYAMYERSYFLDRIDIEENDFNADVFDSDLLNGLARLIHNESEYTVNGLFETVEELEEDVNRQASTFYSVAHKRYQEYCKKIEKLAEEIGENLSDEEMEKLGSSGKRSA